MNRYSRPFPFTPNLTPATVGFLCSAVLSIVAITTSTTLNRDGMLYVDAARVFLSDGLSAAVGVFPWPFLSVLMALLSKATSLDIETCGHILNVLFMAGTSAFLISCSEKIFPEAAWPVCLTLLAIPGINDYRNELLREYGCWFFISLSFWIALRWADSPRWRTACLAQATLVLAALFRPEALAFLATLVVWQAFEAPSNERFRRLSMIGSLSILVLALIAGLAAADLLPQRLAGELSRFGSRNFDATADRIAPGLHEFARENARTMLFYGSLAIIPIKFIKTMGIFLIPLAYTLDSESAASRRLRVFGWAIVTYLLVLSVFVLDKQFLAGRYVAFLALLATPLTGFGLHLLFKSYPKWKIPLTLLAVVIAIANVVSTSRGKQHFIDAGAWLAENVVLSDRVYNESSRSAYYAGWRYKADNARELRPQLADAVRRHEVDVAVLEVSSHEPLTPETIASMGLREVKRFTDPNGDTVIVATPFPDDR